MINEQLEFEISQLADGSLPAEQAVALCAEITGDIEAATLLNSYEKLNSGLRALPPMPSIEWDRLASHLSMSIEQIAIDDRSVAAASYPMPWLRRIAGIAIAAGVVLAVSVGVRISTSSGTAHQPESNTGQMIVAGPAIDSPAGNVVQQITIGPSAAVAGTGDTVRYGDADVVVRPQRVFIASGVDAATTQESQEFPNTRY